MPRSVESVETDLQPPSSGDKRAIRHFGDGHAGLIHAARIQGYSTSLLDYVDVAVDADGQLLTASSGGGGAITVADGADVAQGTTTDVAWVSGAGSLIAISKAEHAKLEQIRALLAGAIATSRTWSLSSGTDSVNVGNFPATQAVSIAAAVPVTDNAGSLTVDAPVGTPVWVRLSDGSAAFVGQKAMAASIPVVLASDQASVPVAATLAAETTKVLGVTRTADGAGALLTSTGQALDVNIKTPATLPISAAALPLPAGAATDAVLTGGTQKSQVTSAAGTAASVQSDADGINGTQASLAAQAKGFYYNGSTWDRARGNFDTTTGDTGTKVATFAGATQTNYNALGALIVVKLGTVSGTSPTLSCQLQWSYDGGTTWMNVGPALANLTTTSNIGIINVYPANISQAAGVTPANLTTGATQTMALNWSLPRLWRINYTIGGTTPSFAITAVYVNYNL